MAETATSAPTIEFPSTPEILIELKEAKSDLDAIGKAIIGHKDLAKEVLDTINAPYFALVRQIKSVDEAVRMLGMNRIINLTTGRLLRTTVFSGKNKLLSDLWKTSIKVAVTSVLVSKELDKAATDESYTTAVFHNAGMALLSQVNPDYTKAIKAAYFEEDSNISDYEISHFSYSHAALGSQLASNWGLSGSMSKCIALHHDPIKTIASIDKGDDAGELLLVLKISEQISRLPGYLAQCVDNHEWQKIKEPIFDELKMTEGMFRRFEAGIKKKIAEIKS